MKDKENKYLIRCIGQDRKIHMCYPWEDKTICGIKIIKKIIKPYDYKNKFFCYECTY